METHQVKWHNPDSLPTAGDPPWRFLVEGEDKDAQKDQYWYRWDRCWMACDPSPPTSLNITYRTRRPLPAPQPGGGGEARHLVDVVEEVIEGLLNGAAGYDAVNECREAVEKLKPFTHLQKP